MGRRVETSRYLAIEGKRLQEGAGFPPPEGSPANPFRTRTSSEGIVLRLSLSFREMYGVAFIHSLRSSVLTLCTHPLRMHPSHLYNRVIPPFALMPDPSSTPPRCEVQIV